MPEHSDSFITPYLLSIVVSTGIGLIIGLEREFRKTNEADHFAGIRTFPLVCLLGCITTFIGNLLSVWIIVSGLLAFIATVGVTYYVRSAKGHTGMTTEVSLVITFVLGMMTSQQLIKEALASTVITTTLLTLKGQFRAFVLKITEEELFAFIKFMILCLLLFPFLPDASYGPNGILNPREIGFIVVVVSSISFVGYLLVKFAGASKGILLTALFGGMASSTAVTWMLSGKSRKTAPDQASLYAAGIILASAIMFLRIIIIAMVFSKPLAMSLLTPCGLISLAGSGFALYFFRKSKPLATNLPIQLGNPVNILNALGFGLMYVAIAYLVFYGEEFLGNRGLILSGLVSGLADIDAITINIAKLTEITMGLNTSVTVVVLAAISNTCVKLMITVFRAQREVRKKVVYALSAMVLAAVAYALINI